MRVAVILVLMVAFAPVGAQASLAGWCARGLVSLGLKTDFNEWFRHLVESDEVVFLSSFPGEPVAQAAGADWFDEEGYSHIGAYLRYGVDPVQFPMRTSGTGVGLHSYPDTRPWKATQWARALESLGATLRGDFPTHSGHTWVIPTVRVEAATWRAQAAYFQRLPCPNLAFSDATVATFNALRTQAEFQRVRESLVTLEIEGYGVDYLSSHLDDEYGELPSRGKIYASAVAAVVCVPLRCNENFLRGEEPRWRDFFHDLVSDRFPHFSAIKFGDHPVHSREEIAQWVRTH